MNNKIKVHLADDHKVLIDGLAMLINTENDIEVVGRSVNGKEVIDWFNSNEADVLILDINMPILDGIEVLRTFNNRGFDQKTIILSALSNPEIVREMIKLGAKSFIEKGRAGDYIIEAIREVHSGKQYLSDDVKDSLLDLFVNDSKIDETIRRVVEEPLTDRELEILKLITQQLSSSEIADKLDVSAKTVETHRRSLYKKLKVKNVVGLAIYAVKNNIV